MTSVRSWSWAALAGLAVPLALTAARASAAMAAQPYDFNGGSLSYAPGVRRARRFTRPASSGNTIYDQDTAGVPGGSEDGGGFGAAVTLLDRNGAGRADLTVGAPGEEDDGSRVTTLLAAGSGFTTVESQAYGCPPSTGTTTTVPRPPTARCSAGDRRRLSF